MRVLCGHGPFAIRKPDTAKYAVAGSNALPHVCANRSFRTFARRWSWLSMTKGMGIAYHGLRIKITPASRGPARTRPALRSVAARLIPAILLDAISGFRLLYHLFDRGQPTCATKIGKCSSGVGKKATSSVRDILKVGGKDFGAKNGQRFDEAC